MGKPKKTMFSENFDVLYMIRARISSGASRGAPQLNKDVRVLKKAEKEIEHLRQQLDELLAVPDGYALVPIDPTREMLDAARTDLTRDGEIDQMLKIIYRAMLEAAQK